LIGTESRTDTKKSPQQAENNGNQEAGEDIHGFYYSIARRRDVCALIRDEFQRTPTPKIHGAGRSGALKKHRTSRKNTEHAEKH